MNQEIQLQITNHQAELLKEFARKQYPGSKDNMSTTTPIHVVEDIRGDESTYRPIAFFFIRDEAKRYIKYQSHNLHKPRIYTYSPGYSNCGDFIPFWNLLHSIGEQLNNKEVVKDEQAC